METTPPVFRRLLYFSSLVDDNDGHHVVLKPPIFIVQQAACALPHRQYARFRVVLRYKHEIQRCRGLGTLNKFSAKDSIKAFFTFCGYMVKADLTQEGNLRCDEIQHALAA